MVPLENGRPLVSLVSRRHVLSARTCPPRTHTPTANCALGAAGSLSSTSLPSHSLSLIPQGSGVKAGVTQNSPRFFTLLSLSVFSSLLLCSLHTDTRTTFLLELRPLLERRFLLSANRGKDTPPFLVTVTGGFFHRWLRCRRLSLAFCSFGGNSRRSRTTALFAWEFWEGNLAASPSIPRGMSPHGARWFWVVVGEVAL